MERPFRLDFFAAFADDLAAVQNSSPRVLELGSGPGFLADYLLKRLPALAMSLLDYSSAMHTLATARLGDRSGQVRFIERDFKDPAWPDGLGQFDAVITLQSVHELRHKRYAGTLHAQVRSLLAPGGIYLVGDHYCGQDGMTNDQLYMSRAEQEQCLSAAGFTLKPLLIKGGRSLYRASLPGD